MTRYITKLQTNANDEQRLISREKLSQQRAKNSSLHFYKRRGKSIECAKEERENAA